MPSDLPPRAVPPTGPSLGGAIEQLRERRGWVIAFGVFSALMGLVALVLTETATLASVLVIGVFMMMAGIAEIVIGFRTRSWGRMILWQLTGLLYVVAGLFAVALPASASVVLTLLLGAGLLATGVLRLVLGLRVTGTRSRNGLILSGMVTALLGLLIVASWPSSSVFVLGTFLGIDLLFYGVTWIVLGVRLGSRRA